MLYFFFSAAKLTVTQLAQEEWVAANKAMSVEIRVLDGADVYEGRAVLRCVAAEPPNGSGDEGRNRGRRLPEALAVLHIMLACPGISIRAIAGRAGWCGKTGLPNAAKVHRILMGLKEDGLVFIYGGRRTVTAKGRKAAELLRPWGQSSAHDTPETACAR